MTRPPPRSTRTDTLFPYPTLFRSFWISANRGHPLPASPCLRRGRGQGKRDDYNAPVKFLASLVLSSLLPFAAHTQVDGTGDYLSRMDSDGDGRISLVE